MSLTARVADISSIWGNVPAWVSGAITAGSLVVAVIVLIRDHREKVRSQADAVGCLLLIGRVDLQSPATWRVRLNNTSSSVIYNPLVFARRLSPLNDPTRDVLKAIVCQDALRPFPGTAEPDVWTVLPSEERTFEFETVPDPWNYGPVIVQFRDSANRSWHRALSDRKRGFAGDLSERAVTKKIVRYDDAEERGAIE